MNEKKLGASLKSILTHENSPSLPEMSLYLGLDISRQWQEAHFNQTLIHCPIIKIEERSLKNEEIAHAFNNFLLSNHLLLTSKVGVKLFFKALSYFGLSMQHLRDKTIIAVGTATAKEIESFGTSVSHIASQETSEGIVELLNTLDLEKARFFWPCSALSRTIIPKFLEEKRVPLQAIALYSVVTRNCKEEIFKILPTVNELIFTSPSTVDAFIELFQTIPLDKKISSIGPITANRLHQIKKKCLTHSQLSL